MANALMGNFSSGTTGAAVSSTVTGASTTAGSLANPTNVAFQISGGGLTSPVTLNLASGSTYHRARYHRYHQPGRQQCVFEGRGHHCERNGGKPAGLHRCVWQQDECDGYRRHGQQALGFGSFVAGAAPTNAQYTTITGSRLQHRDCPGNARIWASRLTAALPAAPISLASISRVGMRQPPPRRERPIPRPPATAATILRSRWTAAPR